MGRERRSCSKLLLFFFSTLQSVGTVVPGNDGMSSVMLLLFACANNVHIDWNTMLDK